MSARVVVHDGDVFRTTVELPGISGRSAIPSGTRITVLAADRGGGVCQFDHDGSTHVLSLVGIIQRGAVERAPSVHTFPEVYA